MEKQGDLGSIGMFAGIILLIAIGAMVLKAIMEFLNQLEKTFEAFAKTAHSFFWVVLEIGKIVTIVGVVAMIVGFTLYVVIKYVKLVRKAAAIRNSQELHEYQVRDLLDKSTTEL